ncbi:MAG: alpha/beta hydrolase [Candidatus Paceibacterota bacterium]
MKKQVFFIHGGNSFSKQEDFLQYLRTVPIRNLPGKETLIKWTKTLSESLGDNYETYTPQMPNSQNSDYEEWRIWFERHFEYLRDGVILIGWSLGGMFLAQYLSENKTPFKIKTLFLLAAPCGLYPGEGGNDCGNFQFDPEILRKLPENATNIAIWHSKDDFVVPYEHALEYKKHLPKAELVTFTDKNHFLIPEFPELIEKIREI